MIAQDEAGGYPQRGLVTIERHAMRVETDLISAATVA